MKLAILGNGSIARQHLQALNALRERERRSDLSIGWVMGRLPDSATAFAAEFGIPKSGTELAPILDDDSIDAVLITTPTDLHASETEQALRRGKHVLCEIPLATSLADVDRLTALADQVDRRLMVCQTQRYYPSLLEAKRRISSGALHPTAIVSRYMFQRRRNVNWVGRQRSWTDNLLWHHGCHAVDAALWLLGATDVETKAEVAAPSGQLNIPMDLAVVMRTLTAPEQIVSVSMSYNTHISLHDYLIIGEEETLLFDNGELRSNEGVLVPRHDLTDLSEPIVDQDREFLDAVRDHRQPAVSGRAVRPAMAALQVAQDSLNAR
jgi:2-hydroxy-4-carboxymuconate semialdehyde hemiacetal dehydrogenase